MIDLNSLLYRRRSTRKFADKPVEVKKTEAVLKAALLAPSGKAVYPCEFIVVDDHDLLELIAKSKKHGATFIAKTPIAIVIAVDTSKTDVWVEDASICAAYMMLAAENEGLGSCWVQMHLRGTDDGRSATENLQKAFNLPDIFEIVAVMALGYKAEEKESRTDDDLLLEKVHHLKYKKH
jgi:nitroreductase